METKLTKTEKNFLKKCVCKQYKSLYDFEINSVGGNEIYVTITRAKFDSIEDWFNPNRVDTVSCVGVFNKLKQFRREVILKKLGI